ncbi:hypothetical protein MTsPCn3_22480 [Erythrobacter sp. MTPC3]
MCAETRRTRPAYTGYPRGTGDRRMRRARPFFAKASIGGGY